MIHSLKYWDRVIEEVHPEYADVEYEKMYVDAAAANMVLEPQRFDVMLTTNMIGDILSDLGGALVGSLGLAPSGNINPEREFPSMFEPIHGSAPDIAGRRISRFAKTRTAYRPGQRLTGAWRRECPQGCELTLDRSIQRRNLGQSGCARNIPRCRMNGPWGAISGALHFTATLLGE